jgi:hypothetical protein
VDAQTGLHPFGRNGSTSLRVGRALDVVKRQPPAFARPRMDETGVVRVVEFDALRL